MMLSFLMGNNASWDSDLMRYFRLVSSVITFHYTVAALSASPLCLNTKLWNTAAAADVYLLSSMNFCFKNITGWRRTPWGTGSWWRNRPSYFSSQDGTLLYYLWWHYSLRHDYSLEQPWIFHCMPPNCTVSCRSCVHGLVWRPPPPQALPSWRLCLWEFLQYLL